MNYQDVGSFLCCARAACFFDHMMYQTGKKANWYWGHADMVCQMDASMYDVLLELLHDVYSSRPPVV